MGFTANDRMTPYPIPQPALDELRRACARHKSVERAYLIRKHTEFLREQPIVVLALEIYSPFYHANDVTSANEIGESLLRRVTLPDISANLLIMAAPPRSRLRKQLRRVAGAEFYRRDTGR